MPKTSRHRMAGKKECPQAEISVLRSACRLLFAMSLSVPAVVTGTAVEAQARSLSIERFDAEIVVDSRGLLDVTETLSVRFEGSWNGIYRFIPVDYRSPRGFGYRIWLESLSVTDGSGESLRYERSRENHYLKFQIWVPGAVDAVRTIRIRYQVSEALRFFEDHDELYWNVTGDESIVPIERATVRLRMPQGVAGMRVAAFVGPYGSQEQSARIEVNGSEIRVATSRPLNLREGLTIAVAWEPGLVRRPGILTRTLYFLRANWIFGLPLLSFLVMFLWWQRRGRDPSALPVVARYSPPEGMSPAEVGTLVDHSPDMRDITATLVDLAVRGFLKIEQLEKEKWLGLSSDTSYRFHLKRPSTEWADLKNHERGLLDGLFLGGSRESAELPDLKNKFYKQLDGIRDGVFGALTSRGYYVKRPDHIKRRFLIGAGVVAGLGIFLAEKEFFEIAPLSLSLSALLSGGVVGLFGLIMPARTTSGARTLEAVLGFQEFLEKVESDRFKRMISGPEMFERYLGFAMALGVDEQWSRAFEDLYTAPPDWYAGPIAGGHFRSSGLVSDLQRMSAGTAAAMASSPRSSGGSGFGGGGSGGGFGGGGVGGF